jgi:hypothetical protein
MKILDSWAAAANKDRNSPCHFGVNATLTFDAATKFRP